jgi:hypothetical protein
MYRNRQIYTGRAKVAAVSVRQSYLSAVHAFATLVDRMPDEAWDRPGLGVWTLRDLVGHTCSAGLLTVLDTVRKPAESETVLSPEGYFTIGRSLDPEVHAAAVAAGTEAARSEGSALGPDPAATIRALVDEVTVALTQVLDDDLVLSAAGGMRLFAWLPTRTFEVVVHSLDLSAAAQVPVTIPDPALADAVVLSARIAAAVGTAPAVLRALTGRGTLPTGFSVL